MPEPEAGERTVSTRISKDMDRRLGQLAAYHGRTKGEELRWALMIFDMQATLAYLQTPGARAELGDELEKAQREVKADLAELMPRALAPAPEVSLAPAPRAEQEESATT